MNAALLIASRDLRDRGRLFFVAACMAVVPFLASFAVKENREAAIAMVSAVVSMAYTCALALGMGVSMIGRDLTEKRMSFFFARPVSPASIWIGKVAGGIATWLGAFLIVMLPTFLFANAGWKQMMWATGWPSLIAFTLITATALFFISHAASTMIRSRSALVAVDFLLLAITVIAIFAMLRPILLGGGLDVAQRIVSVAGIATILILAVAPVWQIARGRVDARRNHAAFSAAFWSGMVVVVIGVAAYATWVISPSLAAMTDLFAADQSPDGKWIYVSGQTKNRGSYLASFLVHRETGERERVAVSPWGTVHATRDGKSIVWMQYDDLLPGRGSFRFYTRRLEPGAKQIATPLTVSTPRHQQLSNDGSRIAITHGDRLEVYELATGRLLGAASINAGDIASIFFAGTNVVRVVEITQGATRQLTIRTFDLARKKFSNSAPIPVQGSRFVQCDEEGSRIYVRGSGVVIDAGTGAVATQLPVQPARAPFAAMLRDGTMMVTRDGRLYHFDRNGAPLADIAIPVPQALVVAQLGESKVVMMKGGQKPAEWITFVVDLAAKKSGTVTKGMLGAYSWWGDPLVPKFAEDAEIVSMESERELVLWNPRTGAKRRMS